MKKKVITTSLMAALMLSLSACGGSQSSEETAEEPTEKEYVADDQVKDVLTSPDKFEGKYIKTARSLTVQRKTGMIIFSKHGIILKMLMMILQYITLEMTA